jgi:hypothetical protein
LKAVGDELLLASTAERTLRAYQHCPGRSDQVRLIGEIVMPGDQANMEISDVAVYGDYLFVTEVHHSALSEPDRGSVHAYRWKDGPIPACPARPAELAPVYVGSFAQDMVAYRLALADAHRELALGASAHPTFPVKAGGVFLYDLDRFDPADVASFDQERQSAPQPEAWLATGPNVHGLVVSGDELYVVDRDNGVFAFSLASHTYEAFYPAHRGPENQGYTPQMVESPADVVPLYHPVAATMLPSGRIAVHEHNSGRVAILAATPARAPAFLPLALVP